MPVGRVIGDRTVLIGICKYTQVQRVFYRHDATFRESFKDRILPNDLEVMKTFHEDPDIPLIITEDRRLELESEFNSVMELLLTITKGEITEVEALPEKDQEDYLYLTEYAEYITKILHNPTEYTHSLHLSMLYPYCKENTTSPYVEDTDILKNIFYSQLKYLKAIIKDTYNDCNADHRVAAELRSAAEKKMIGDLLKRVYRITGLTDDVVEEMRNRYTYGYRTEVKVVRGKEIKVKKKFEKKIGKFTAIFDLGYGSVMCRVIIEMIEKQLIELRDAYQRMGLTP